MRVDLPSGHWAELRDQMLHGDVRFAKKAAKFRVSRAGDSDVDLSFEDEVTGAILYRMLVQWDVGQALPRTAQNLELALGILDMLEEDDFAAIAVPGTSSYLAFQKVAASEIRIGPRASTAISAASARP